MVVLCIYCGSRLPWTHRSKYIMRKESTRDHVDLLSSRHWPTVYAVDMACDVVVHMEVREPRLASTLWGDRRGCFEVPSTFTSPKVRYSILQCTYWMDIASPCWTLEIYPLLTNPISYCSPIPHLLLANFASSNTNNRYCWRSFPWWATHIRTQEKHLSPSL